MLFKDYEYGWYGFNGSYKGKYMDKGYYNTTVIKHSNRNHNLKDQIYNNYIIDLKGTLKQLPKLKDVVFIYGDYKESV